MYENWKIAKSELEEKAEKYAQVADWCNSSGAFTIVENGEFYEVAPVVVPEPEPEAVENEQVVEDSNL